MPCSWQVVVGLAESNGKLPINNTYTCTCIDNTCKLTDSDCLETGISSGDPMTLCLTYGFGTFFRAQLLLLRNYYCNKIISILDMLLFTETTHSLLIRPQLLRSRKFEGIGRL